MNPGIKLSRHRYTNVLLFADDLLVLQNTESYLQKSVFKIHQICKKYNTNISTIKIKVMTFSIKGTDKKKHIPNYRTDAPF